jgi:hypothetical protein
LRLRYFAEFAGSACKPRAGNHSVDAFKEKMKTCILTFFAAAAFAATPAIDPKLYLDDVKYLASPELRGRATGSPELEKAAGFIAGKFREFGLKGVNGNGYYQPFQAITSTKLGKSNHFRVQENGRTHTLQLQSDFVPMNFSAAAKLAGPMVFVGYGITADHEKYDDYAGIDVKGKVVVLLRHEPQEDDAQSVFAGKQLTSHALFTSKASNAKMHGASGVILVNDTPHHRDQTEELQKFGLAEGAERCGDCLRAGEIGAGSRLVCRRGQELGPGGGGHRQEPQAAIVRVSGDDSHGRRDRSGAGSKNGSQRDRISAGGNQRVHHHRRALRSSGVGRSAFARSQPGRNSSPRGG